MKSSAFLLAGYLVGQGGVFLLQLLLKIYGYQELLGMTVLAVSFVSLSLQFSDFGNATVVVRSEISGNRTAVVSYLIGRAVLGFAISAIVSFYFYIKYGSGPAVDSILLFSPVLALFCGLSAVGIDEAKKHYASFAVTQAVPWIVLAGSLFILCFSEHRVDLAVFPILFTAILIVRFTWSRSGIDLSRSLFSRIPVGVYLAVPIVLAPISGQIWGRIVLFMVGDKVGLSALGEFGLARNIQVAWLLTLSFMSRPILRNFLDKVRADNSSANLFDLVLCSRRVLGLSMWAPLSVGLVYFMGYLSDGYMWYCILAIIPVMWIHSQVHVINQLTFKFKWLVIVDHVGLIFGVFVFLLFIERSPLLAVVFSEVIQVFVGVLAHVFFKKRVGA